MHAICFLAKLSLQGKGPSPKYHLDLSGNKQ